MEYITLKNTDLQVSRVCMGGCPMGGHGWGNVQEQELLDAVNAALDNGINFFDTADTYGLGKSEETLSKALGAHRKEAVVATKFGVRVGSQGTFYDNSPQWVRTACENSLRRLNTDYIDLYQIHYRDGKTPLAEVMGTLEDLQKEGKIRYLGISNLTRKDLPELLPYAGKFATLQNQYSLATRELEEDILELANVLNLTPTTWGSLGQGVLTGKYDRSASFGSDDRRSRQIYVNFHGEKLEKNLQIVDVLQSIAAKYGKPVSAVAVRFILDQLPGSIALCGAKRPAQILGTAAALGWQLESEDLHCLAEISR